MKKILLILFILVQVVAYGQTKKYGYIYLDENNKPLIAFLNGDSVYTVSVLNPLPVSVKDTMQATFDTGSVVSMVYLLPDTTVLETKNFCDTISSFRYIDSTNNHNDSLLALSIDTTKQTLIYNISISIPDSIIGYRIFAVSNATAPPTVIELEKARGVVSNVVKTYNYTIPKILGKKYKLYARKYVSQATELNPKASCETSISIQYRSR